MLSLLIFLPLIFAFAVYFFNDEILKIVGVLFSFVVFALSFYFMLEGYTQFNLTLIKAFNFGINLRADFISYVLLIVANFMLFISIFYLKVTQKYFLASAMVLSSCMNGLFLANDALLFYIFWEVSLLPLLYIMSREKLFNLAKKFFIFAFLGSILMLISIVYLAYQARVNGAFLNFDISYFDESNNIWLFLGFFIAFAIKAPLFPFHSWAIRVYSKSNNFVSIMLVSFKMAPFGMIKFCVGLFSGLISDYACYISLLCVFSAIYAAILAFSTKNYKELIALSSISHLGVIILGIFSGHEYALSGAVFYMVAHAITSGALFLFADILKDRFDTYDLEKLGLLASKMPFLTFLFAVFLFSSISLPGSANFIGEFLVLYGVFAKYKTAGVFATLLVVFSAVYMLNMFRNVFFSTNVNEATKSSKYKPNILKICILAFLAFLVIYLGIHPNVILYKELV